MNPHNLMPQLQSATPAQVRAACREGYLGPTSGMAQGWIQANLIIVPKEDAWKVLLFATRNPVACPLLDVFDTGATSSALFQGDIRTDLPAYRIYQDGKLTQDLVADVSRYWREDLVSFLFGCSFSFETALQQQGIAIRHIDAQRNVPMYISNIDCAEAEGMRGKMVVSMRSIPAHQVADAVRITARYSKTHGSPVHIGNPEFLGINHIEQPDFGDAPVIQEGDLPVFWACGVTPQVAVLTSKLPFCISHCPGMMAIMDLEDKDIIDL